MKMEIVGAIATTTLLAEMVIVHGGKGEKMETPKYFYFRVRVINKGTSIEVEDASDVDVVEVVRCKDCKHGERDDIDFPNQYLCHYYGDIWNKGEHYCAEGAKTDEAD